MLNPKQIKLNIFILLEKMLKNLSKMLSITKKIRIKSHIQSLNLNLNQSQSQNWIKNPLPKHWENWIFKNISQ